MKTFRLDDDGRYAMLMGAASIFDLSGTGMLSDARLGSVGTDLKEIRKDFRAIKDDLRAVVRVELEQLKKESDGGRC